MQKYISFLIVAGLILLSSSTLMAQTTNQTINGYLTNLFAKANLSDEVSRYSGSLCPTNPIIGYARTKGFITLSSCPSPTKKINLGQAYEATYKTYLSQLSDLTQMKAFVYAYDGVDISGLNKPYGVFADPYKFMFMIQALVNPSLASDPYSTTYGNTLVSIDESEKILDSIYNESWLSVFNVNDDSWWQPIKGLTWEILLQGVVDTQIDAEAFDIDLFDTSRELINQLHSDGKRVICYLSAGSYENWRPDAKDFTRSVRGRSNGWTGENWLDIRNQNVLGPIMRTRFNVALIKGCDAIDADNVDGYTNKTGFPLNYQDQLNYNLFLSREAHARGLAIGLKNDLNQIPDLVNHFDFAINESCYDYDECSLLDPFIQADKPVLGIEYELPVADFCDDANAKGYSFLKKDWDLMTAGEACWDLN